MRTQLWDKWNSQKRLYLSGELGPSLTKQSESKTRVSPEGQRPTDNIKIPKGDPRNGVIEHMDDYLRYIFSGLLEISRNERE